PRRALGKADADLVNLIVVPMALFLLIVLPLTMLYRLSGVLDDRRSRVVVIQTFATSELASTGQRLVALSIDWILTLIPMFVLIVLVVATFKKNAPASVFYFAILPLSYALATVPFVLRYSEQHGQSLRKQLLRIQVVDAE